MRAKKFRLLLVTLACVFILYSVFRSMSDKINVTNSMHGIPTFATGRDMICAPKDDNGSAIDNVSLVCGERMQNYEEGAELLRQPGQQERFSGVIARGQLVTLNQSIYEFEGAVTKSLFAQDPDGYVHMFDQTKHLDLHCDVCAVVSSSGQLLGTNAGNEIDNASCVIRMNIAPTKGYEADVGTRTTVRISSFINLQLKKFKESRIFQTEKLPEKLLIWSNNRPGIRTMVTDLSRNLVKTYSGLDIYLATVEEIDFNDKLFEKETGRNRDESFSWLSTGWFTMVFALKRCKRVNAYGFIEADYCDRITNRQDKPFHYYSKDKTECMDYRKHEILWKAGHRFFTEKYIFKKWARLFNLTFHYPEWDIWKRDPKTPFLSRLNDTKTN